MTGIKAAEALGLCWLPQRIFGEARSVAVTLPGEKPLRNREMKPVVWFRPANVVVS